MQASEYIRTRAHARMQTYLAVGDELLVQCTKSGTKYTHVEITHLVNPCATELVDAIKESRVIVPYNCMAVVKERAIRTEAFVVSLASSARSMNRIHGCTTGVTIETRGFIVKQFVEGRWCTSCSLFIRTGSALIACQKSYAI